ncbi:acyl-CoA mutase large subunit family protein [bacterium]|nr:acyl-CoA mutase large subunit family protein [bacterium]
MTTHKPEPPAVGDEQSYHAPALELHNEFPVPSLEEWRQVVEKDLKGADFDKKLVWRTHEGLAVKPLYARPDLDSVQHLGGLPGQAPFTRGTDALQNVAEPWLVRQDCVLTDPADANATIRRGLERGMTAVGLRPDDAARAGVDPDGNDLVGRGGVCLHTLADMQTALEGVDLAAVPVAIRAGASAPAMLAMLVALADAKGLDRKSLSGVVECDPLGDLARGGKSRAALDALLNEAHAMAAFAAKECPKVRTVTVDGSTYHNAGASAVQELAYAIAAGAEYLRALTERGIDANAAARSIAFNFSVSTNLFMEIGKLRAARTVWAKIVAAFGADDAEAQKMVMHVRTSCHTKTVFDPYTNMLRTTIEAFAGAVGGCQSMFVAPFDEVLGKPDEFSARIARNQQIVLREESYLNKAVDPAAGSYYVEALTDSIAKAAWDLFREVEKTGGLAAALKAGTPQAAIRDTAAKKRKAITGRRDPIVGTSNYPNPTETLPKKAPLDGAAVAANRKAHFENCRAGRDEEALAKKLAQLTDAAREAKPEAVAIAAEALAMNATIGEVLAALNAAASGDAESIEKLEAHRAAEPFEALRHRANSASERPRVLLVPMGPLAMRKARAGFCFGFFGAGGFEVEEAAAPDSTDAAVKAILDSGSRVAVICSDDASYPEVVPPIVEKVRAAKKDVLVYVAGYPKESVEALEAAGVDGFVHVRSDVVETLSALQDRLGLA